MNNQIHELSRGDLDQVSGGLRNFPSRFVLCSRPGHFRTLTNSHCATTGGRPMRRPLSLVPVRKRISCHAQDLRDFFRSANYHICWISCTVLWGHLGVTQLV
jgi:hypothetical protein